MTVSYSLISGLILGSLLALVLRRILGTHVGWPRALAVGVVAALVAGPLLSALAVPLGLVDTDGRQIASNGALVALIALAGLWIIGLCAAVLLVWEVLAPTGSVPSPVAIAVSVRGRWARTRRSVAILRIIGASGLRRTLRRGPDDPEFAAALVTTLNRAGVTFVKLGQFLATRRDMVSEPLADALGSLQTRATPVPWERIDAVLTGELGADWRRSFAQVDQQPLAAASVAQVHRATLRDGTAVALKVQRPDAEHQVTVDCDILRRLAGSAEARFGWARSMGLRGLADSFARSLRDELDYRIEARNLELARAALADQPMITLPALYPALSTRRVLVQDLLDGTTLDYADDDLAVLDTDTRAALSQALITAALGGVLVGGIFHADLHPGNIMLLPDGRLGLLDFGSVGVLDAETRDLLATMLFAILHDDNVVATDAVLMAFDVSEHVDVRALRRDIGRESAVLRHAAALDDATAGRLFTIIRAHGVAVPGQVAAAFRTLASVEESLTALTPGTGLMTAARDTLPDLLREIASPQRQGARALGSASILAATTRRLPERVESTTRRVADGTLSLTTRVFADPDDRSWVRRTITETMSVVLACTAVVAAVLLILSGGGPALTPALDFYPFLGWILAFAGTMLAFRSVLRLFRRGPVPPHG